MYNGTRKNHTANLRKSDALLDRLLFMAKYYGRKVSADQIINDTPLPEGRITHVEIEECAARAGLAITKFDQTNLRKSKSSMFPAIVETIDGFSIVILNRKKNFFECSQANIKGTKWVHYDELMQDYKGNYYFVRPTFFFDVRTLLYHESKSNQWFWDVLKANRWIYSWALVGTVIINLIGAVIPFYTMAVYDRVVPNNALDSLWVLTSFALTFMVFDLLMKALRSYLVDAAARKADIKLSARIFTQSLRMRAASRPASGGILANIVRDFESIRDFFTSSTLTFLGDLPFMFFYLGIIALISGWLVLVPIAIIPIVLVISYVLQQKLAKIVSENTKDNSQRTAHLFEVMNGLDTIKCLGAESWARRKWEMLTVKLSEDSMRMRKISSLGTQTTGMLIMMNSIFIVMFGALLIAEGDLSMGQLIATSMLSSRALMPIGQISGLIIRWQQTKISLVALNEIMDAPTDNSSVKLNMTNLKGNIEFRNVDFSYPNSSPLLKNLNLKFKQNEKIGFIGRLGSGKSTLLRLLINLYSPSQGTVLVDNIALDQLDHLSLRRQIGYVPQDITLFHGTILENIMLGSTDISDDDLMKAIEIACLKEPLSQLPEGLATQVGERGERLSGGQRQTVAIARAIVKKPKILLLDEPSSMMDPATEQQFIQQLRVNLPETTVLLVTHRMAMLPLVDRLIVFDHGKVIIDGPRELVLRRLQSSASGEKTTTTVAKLPA
ncbi:MAG: type I secretion system permease/ATPase [Methylococcales bacterium]|nr:type I secretion system permease/ATPase [Methylococcales bacterium]